jgi:hypothetical protein
MSSSRSRPDGAAPVQRCGIVFCCGRRVGSVSVSTFYVMPAKAGIQLWRRRHGFGWIPACAGMTFEWVFLQTETLPKILVFLGRSDYSFGSVIHVRSSRVSRQGFASLLAVHNDSDLF